MASTKESATLNETQTKFLAILMRNVKGKPDIDVSSFFQEDFLPLCKVRSTDITLLTCPKFDAVSKELGITQKSAKERFRLLSVKMGWKDGPSTPKKPTGVTKRTPSKVGGGKRVGKDKAQLSPDDRDESDEEVNKMDSSDELVKDEGEA